jgi:hypothetical protein
MNKEIKEYALSVVYKRRRDLEDSLTAALESENITSIDLAIIHCIEGGIPLFGVENQINNHFYNPEDEEFIQENGGEIIF